MEVPKWKGLRVINNSNRNGFEFTESVPSGVSSGLRCNKSKEFKKGCDSGLGVGRLLQLVWYPGGSTVSGSSGNSASLGSRFAFCGYFLFQPSFRE